MAPSWFWEKRKKSSKHSIPSSQTRPGNADATGSEGVDVIEEKNVTLAKLLQENGNGGREFFTGGRRCPAHEDADGFAAVLLELLNE